MFFIAIILSILSGVTNVVARIINANLAKIIGLFQGTLFNYVIGLLVSLLFLLFNLNSMDFTSTTFLSVPIWAYLGGMLGVMVVVISNYLTPRISAFYLTLLMFIGQLFAGIIIDYVASSELSIGKIIGGIFVLAGLSYNLYFDKKNVDTGLSVND
ncbi:MAG: putative rane protein [Anaerocolumna sp.]|jgi:transporter family-2 protein|nr:putative rane protein [Anaerocolumna sp.]